MHRLLLCLLLATTQAVPAEEALRPPSDAYQDLLDQWNRALQDYAREEDAAKTPEARKAVFATYPKPAFQERFMQLAREHPKDPAIAVPALTWVLMNPWSGPQAEKNFAEALEILSRDFLDDEKFASACGVLGSAINSDASAGGLHPGTERVLRLALEKSRSRRVRGTACFSLACYLQSHSRMRSAGMSPETAAAMAAEAETRYEQVVDQFADVAGGGPYTLGQLAEAALFEIHNLAVGKVAPEITGDDLEGQPMTLGDYRGKVVLLSFWASWCGPCMRMVPREKSLAERFRGRPFVILGFNGDDERETASRVEGREQIPWRSWWDRGRHATIIRRWNVVGWPTTYLLDARGVIRFKNVSPDDLDKSVETLVKEAESR